MTTKRILSLILAVMMVLVTLPVALAETEPNVVYGYSIGGEVFYLCDENGNYDSQTTIEPDTITHLFLQPAKNSTMIAPLRMADRTQLRWLKVLDPAGIGLSFQRDSFSDYVNLEEVILPEILLDSELELFENTALRSFTLPKHGTHEPYVFQGCTTIEEIINPSDQDVSLVVHHKDITIPAGETWKAEFGVTDITYYGLPNAPVSIQLKAHGADSSLPLEWSFFENASLPEGFTLTKDGLLSGHLTQDVQYIYVTAVNGEKSADAHVYLGAMEGVTVTTQLPEGVTLKNGPVGEKALDTRNTAIFSFALADTLPEGYSLQQVKLSEVFDDGTKRTITSEWYSLRNNVLYLDAETVHYAASQLIVAPVLAADMPHTAAESSTLASTHNEILGKGKLTHFPNSGIYEAKGYKTTLSVGEKLTYSLLNPNNPLQNTLLLVYQEVADGVLQNVNIFELNNVAFGEQGAFFCPSDGTYYLFAACYNDSTLEGCTFTVDRKKVAVPFPENPKYTDTLSFVEDVPTAEPDDLWAWNNDTKTLTLKNGFTLNNPDEDGIELPDDATIIVEGKATIVAESDAILAQTNLTVQLKSNTHLVLIALSDEALQVERGLLKITGDKKTAKLSAYAFSDDAIYAGSAFERYDEENNDYIQDCDIGDIEIANLTLDITSSSDALQSYEGTITIDNCDITIDSLSDGILVDYNRDEPALGHIALTNCKLFARCIDQAVQTYCGGITLTDCDVDAESSTVIRAKDDIVVSGGRMFAKSTYANPVVTINRKDDLTANVTFTNVAIKLNATDFSIFEGDIENVIIESPYTLCYANQTDGIVHTGEWDEQTYFNLIIQGKIPTLLQTMVFGDLDGDMAVSAADALVALKSVVGKAQLTDYEQILGNVNGDDKVDAADALDILKKVVGKIEKFTVKQKQAFSQKRESLFLFLQSFVKCDKMRT